MAGEAFTHGFLLSVSAVTYFCVMADVYCFHFASLFTDYASFLSSSIHILSAQSAMQNMYSGAQQRSTSNPKPYNASDASGMPVKKDDANLSLYSVNTESGYPSYQQQGFGTLGGVGQYGYNGAGLGWVSCGSITKNFVDVNVLQRSLSGVWWSSIIYSWRDQWTQSIWPENDDSASSPLFSRNKHLSICSILHWSRG